MKTMAKKQQEKKEQPKTEQVIDPLQEQMDKLPKDVQEKIKALKKKLDEYKDEILKKFDKYIMGISLLPPPQPKEGEQLDKERVDLLILVDDRDSQNRSQFGLKDKQSDIMEN